MIWPEPVRLAISVERWPFEQPIAITGYVFDAIEVVVVEASCAGCTGRGEATGVYYKQETAGGMAAALTRLGEGLEPASVTATCNGLGVSGARNALDAALWDLEARLSGMPAWVRAGVANLRPLTTTFTCGAAEPAEMAARARRYVAEQGAATIKLKLTGDARDRDRVAAVRDSCPACTLLVDANQGYTRASLEAALPAFLDAGVALVEQPLPVGRDHELAGLDAPIPLAADESLQTVNDLSRLLGIYDVANIKLDKCGGLTAALEMAAQARELGLKLMVGNMPGTSLAMAPAFVLGQLCDVVDLDGPLFLTRDRAPGLDYAEGEARWVAGLWGSSE